MCCGRLYLTMVTFVNVLLCLSKAGCVLVLCSVSRKCPLGINVICCEVYRDDVFCVKHVTNALCCVVVFVYGRMCSCDLSCVLCQTSDHQDCRHTSRLLQFSKFSSAYNCVPNCVSIALGEQIFVPFSVAIGF